MSFTKEVAQAVGKLLTIRLEGFWLAVDDLSEPPPDRSSHWMRTDFEVSQSTGI